MSWFPEYTIESAPAGSRRFMVATQNHLGYLPAATARWAASPHLLEGFGRMLAIFENVISACTQRRRGAIFERRDE